MIVPSTRYFTAGEVETGAYLNASVTNLGNFLLGRPIASIYTTYAQSFTAGSSAAITWASGSGGVLAVNRDNGWSATNATRYTVGTAGWYWINAGANWSASAATYRGVYLYVNGGTAVPGSSTLSYATTIVQTNCTGFVYLNAGDYVELFGRCQGANTALVAPTIGSTATAFINLVWVSL